MDKELVEDLTELKTSLANMPWPYDGDVAEAQVSHLECCLDQLIWALMRAE